jgi:hypothetical protein
MTSLLVSVTVSERNGHQGTLQKAKMELEERVLERTRELEDRIARQERAEKAMRGLSARLLQVKDQERLITGHHSAIDPRRHSTQGVCIPFTIRPTAAAPNVKSAHCSASRARLFDRFLRPAWIGRRRSSRALQNKNKPVFLPAWLVRSSLY